MQINLISPEVKKHNQRVFIITLIGIFILLLLFIIYSKMNSSGGLIESKEYGVTATIPDGWVLKSGSKSDTFETIGGAEERSHGAAL